MANTTPGVDPGVPGLHIDPYEGAKSLRFLLRGIRDKLPQGKNTANLNLQTNSVKGKTLLAEAQQRATEENTTIARAIELLSPVKQAGEQRKVKEMRIACEHLRTELIEISNLSKSTQAALEDANVYVRWVADQGVPQAVPANGTELVNMVRECRLIAQALPTSPMNATTPAEVVLQAVVTILSNFKYVEATGALEKPKHPATPKEDAEKWVAFEDEFGMTKEEYIANNGDLPDEWKEDE